MFLGGGFKPPHQTSPPWNNRQNVARRRFSDSLCPGIRADFTAPDLSAGRARFFSLAPGGPEFRWPQPLFGTRQVPNLGRCGVDRDSGVLRDHLDGLLPADQLPFPPEPLYLAHTEVVNTDEFIV